MEFREPTDDEIKAMAVAAQKAAAEKARELGLDTALSLVGLLEAGEAAMKTMLLIDAIGFEATIELGDALMKAELYDLGKEANEILNKED